MRPDNPPHACTGAVRRAAAAGARRAAAALVAWLALVAGCCPPAFAHTAARAFVLTLPTELYITGGAVVVGVSAVLVALVPAANVRAIEAAVRRAGRLPAGLGTVLSLACLLATIALVLAGRYGTQDPLENPLPLAVWTLWWIGLTAAHALLGDLWPAINPWRGLYDLIAGTPGARRRIGRPPLRYPGWLGHWPAVATFLAFAWFELIYTVPSNPEVLASVVGLYGSATFLCMLLFGQSAWLRYGEAFSVFFRVVAWLSPLNGRPDRETGADGGPETRRLFITLPGLGLLHVRPLPPSGVAFVLLMLSSVSFDGLDETYWWLSRIGVNPLDFPGRSAVALPNTLGLIGAFAALSAAYSSAVWLGHLLAGRRGRLAESLGRYAVAIVPIAIGYHFAHYLTAFLVDVQYAAVTLSDPFGRGWNLIGLSDEDVTTSFLTNFDSVRLIWHCQVAGIVIAHVIAVAIAHLIAIRQTGRRRTAIVSQVPMIALMIAYTLFGLWLLSAPAAG